LLPFLNFWCRLTAVTLFELRAQSKDIALAEWTVVMAPFDPKIQTIGVIDVVALQLAD
jgi:hypothetical protein